MNGNEVWTLWKPENYIHESSIEKVAFYEGTEGLVIKVENDTKIYSFIFNKIEFGNYVEVFRTLDEMKAGYLSEVFGDARKKELGSINEKWYLYKTKSSEFIDWFDNLPGPGTDLNKLEHFVICTSDTTFEIISRYEPKLVVENK